MLNKLLPLIANSGHHSPALALETLLTTGEVIAFGGSIPIQDNGERLVEIRGAGIELANPHPHVRIGAEYGCYSPFFVREGVLDRLQQAAAYLEAERPECRLYIYDAYRPLSVQRFMVVHTFAQLAAERDVDPATADHLIREALMQEVLRVWAQPNADPRCPPPHSTGAAVDVTLIDTQGRLLDMGSEIDRLGDVSLPHYFAGARRGPEVGYHANRELLRCVMSKAGFRRLPHEWWHFSFGDQIWALLQWLDNPVESCNAIYGRYED